MLVLSGQMYLNTLHFTAHSKLRKAGEVFHDIRPL